MSAEFFLDTNILVYSFDAQNPSKQRKARSLIRKALKERIGIISWQVVQEFLNVAMHRWEKPLSSADASHYLETVLIPLCRVFPQPTLWKRALQIHDQSQYRLYDSLIVAAAEESRVQYLYSEDLQAGQAFGQLEIVNPFS